MTPKYTGIIFSFHGKHSGRGFQEEISALIDTCTVLVAIWTIEMALAWLRKGVLNLLLLDISLAVQWLRLHVPNAGAMDAIPGQGTKSPHGAANR